MGRSVSYPTGALVCFTVLECENDDDWEFEFEWLTSDCLERACDAFPSLASHDGWRGREDRILARNAYADFGISVYGSLVAIWIVERNDGSYWDGDYLRCVSPRAQYWLGQITARFDTLFGDYDRIGTFSNGESIYQKRSA